MEGMAGLVGPTGSPGPTVRFLTLFVGVGVPNLRE